MQVYTYPNTICGRSELITNHRLASFLFELESRVICSTISATCQTDINPPHVRYVTVELLNQA